MTLLCGQYYKTYIDLYRITGKQLTHMKCLIQGSTQHFVKKDLIKLIITHVNMTAKEK